MNAEELAAIPIWIDREISRRQIPRLYSELAAAVQNNANGSRQAFEAQRAQLAAELSSVDLTSLTDAQADLLRSKLSLLQHLGKEGVSQVEAVLFRNSLDIVTAASEINRIASEVQSAVDRSNQIRSAVSGLIDPFETPQEEVILRVVFTREAAIHDIADFKRWATEWHDIGRGVAMAAGASPKDIRVVGAQTGSIILSLATTWAIAKVVSSILLKSLEVAEKVQGLRKAELEVKALKLKNSVAIDAIRKQIEAERQTGLEEIGKSVAKEHANLDGERVLALEKAVSKLLKFVEKGGEVDVVLPLSVDQEGEPESLEVRRLKTDVSRIRELEQEMRRLPQLEREEENE